MNIQLNLINNSNDANNSQVVIFQRNVATNFDETAVAWKVIEFTGRGDSHRFEFPLANSAVAADATGGDTGEPVPVSNGTLLSAVDADDGLALKASGTASSAKEIQVLNQRTQGSIDTQIYKDGRLLAIKSSVAPGQKAVFQFKPTIWIGVVADVQAGEVLDSATLSQVNTELSLMGIVSADIVMTGGGPGPNAKPFSFTLQNVVMA
jgi:hypothetical protein